ncbi:MAG: hypothetical protein ACLUNQ_02745 [Oscillospiraceae bacterium]
MAQLYFKFGAMGSSKSANALMARFNYEERGQDTLLVKPQLDTRDGDHMVRSPHRPGASLYLLPRDAADGRLRPAEIRLHHCGRGPVSHQGGGLLPGPPGGRLQYPRYLLRAEGRL